MINTRSLSTGNKPNVSNGSSANNNASRKTFLVPAGNIDQVLMLDSKSPTEEKFYSFTLRNRMLLGDTIVKVDVRPAGDSDIIADQPAFSDDGLGFSIRLKGGKINQNIGLLFQVTTQKGEILDFVCTLPVRAQGVLAKEGNVVVVIGGPAVGKGGGYNQSQ